MSNGPNSDHVDAHARAHAARIRMLTGASSAAVASCACSSPASRRNRHSRTTTAAGVLRAPSAPSSLVVPGPRRRAADSEGNQRTFDAWASKRRAPAPAAAAAAGSLPARRAEGAGLLRFATLGLTAADGGARRSAPTDGDDRRGLARGLDACAAGAVGDGVSGVAGDAAALGLLRLALPLGGLGASLEGALRSAGSAQDGGYDGSIVVTATSTELSPTTSTTTSRGATTPMVCSACWCASAAAVACKARCAAAFRTMLQRSATMLQRNATVLRYCSRQEGNAGTQRERKQSVRRVWADDQERSGAAVRV
jgi:hypothetical protein